MKTLDGVLLAITFFLLGLMSGVMFEYSQQQHFLMSGSGCAPGNVSDICPGPGDPAR